MFVDVLYCEKQYMQDTEEHRKSTANNQMALGNMEKLKNLILELVDISQFPPCMLLYIFKLKNNYILLFFKKTTNT